MLVEIPNGGSVNITTELGVADTVAYGIESNFDTNQPVYVRLASTSSEDQAEYDSVVLAEKDSPHSFKSVQGVAGQSLFAYRPSTNGQEQVFLRVTTA